MYTRLALAAIAGGGLGGTALAAPSQQANGKLTSAVEVFCQSQRNKGSRDEDVAKLCAQVSTPKNSVTIKAAPIADKAAATAKAPAASDQTPAELPAQTTLKTEDSPSGRFVIRRDRSQLFEGMDSITGKGADAPGASVTYSEDNLRHTRSGNFQGFASYTYYKDFELDGSGNLTLASVGLSPWIFSTGSLSLPVSKTRPALSAVQAGIDSQASFANVLSSTWDFGVSPYAQTDFLGAGQITGVTAHVRPTNSALNINFSSPGDALISNNLVLFGEVNAMHVQDAGYTRFKTGSDYTFIGGTAQLRLNFLNGNSVAALTSNQVLATWLSDRLFANGTMQYYSDANSSLVVRKYEAEFGYKLNPARAAGQSTAGGGQSSVSVVYTKGTDISTLFAQEQVKVQLNYRY